MKSAARDLFSAKAMASFGSEFKPQRRLGMPLESLQSRSVVETDRAGVLIVLNLKMFNFGYRITYALERTTRIPHILYPLNKCKPQSLRTRKLIAENHKLTFEYR